MTKFVFTIAIVFSAQLIWAIQDSAPKCDMFLKDQKIGATCFTSKGIQFKRVEINGQLGIQDLGEGGKIWFDDITGYGYEDAFNKCLSKDQILPSVEDFFLANTHGFQQAIGYDSYGYFWTSKRHYGMTAIFDTKRSDYRYDNCAFNSCSYVASICVNR